MEDDKLLKENDENIANVVVVKERNDDNALMFDEYNEPEGCPANVFHYSELFVYIIQMTEFMRIVGTITFIAWFPYMYNIGFTIIFPVGLFVIGGYIELIRRRNEYEHTLFVYTKPLWNVIIWYIFGLSCVFNKFGVNYQLKKYWLFRYILNSKNSNIIRKKLIVLNYCILDRAYYNDSFLIQSKHLGLLYQYVSNKYNTKECNKIKLRNIRNQHNIQNFYINKFNWFLFQFMRVWNSIELGIFTGDINIIKPYLYNNIYVWPIIKIIFSFYVSLIPFGHFIYLSIVWNNGEYIPRNFELIYAIYLMYIIFYVFILLYGFIFYIPLHYFMFHLLPFVTRNKIFSFFGTFNKQQNYDLFQFINFTYNNMFNGDTGYDYVNDTFGHKITNIIYHYLYA